MTERWDRKKPEDEPDKHNAGTPSNSSQENNLDENGKPIITQAMIEEAKLGIINPLDRPSRNFSSNIDWDKLESGVDEYLTLGTGGWVIDLNPPKGRDDDSGDGGILELAPVLQPK